MRTIDGDALKKCAIPCEIHNGALTDLCVPLYQIDNAPTVEMIEEMAIDKLHETGWMQKHDKEMTERPQGEWIEDYTKSCHSFLGYHCSICNSYALDINDYSFPSNFCPHCGAKMKIGGAENE